MAGHLRPGDDHNLLSNRTVGDPHPQYLIRGHTLNGMGALVCPFTLMDTVSGFNIIEYACGGVLGLFMQGYSPVDQGFNVKLGGPAEASTRRQLLIEGRTSEALCVTGAYGLGGDPMFQVHAFAGKVEAVVDGDVMVTGQINVLSDLANITANQNPFSGTVRSLLRLTSDIDGRQIQSIAAPAPQDLSTFPIIDIINVGTKFITFVHQYGSATATNRIICNAAGTNIDLAANDTIRIWYDPDTLRWRILK